MGLISNGTTLLDAGALDSGVATGTMTLIKTLTASSSGTLSFVDGSASVVLDGTYKEYIFKFFDMHPATDAVEFQFQGNAAGGSGYNETITSTFFRAFHNYDSGTTGLGYQTGSDQANGTAFQTLIGNVGNDNDQSLVGYLHLFNPSSTTFVKHFIAKLNYYGHDNGSANDFVAGYFNTTSAIDEIQFKMSSGNIDAGTIKLYGIK